jgi:hypothetical protein
MEVYVIWLASTCACVAGIVVVRSIRLKRRPRRADFRWGGVVGMSLLAGTLPAIAYALMPGPEVEVPQAVLDSIMVRGEQP